jgi:proteasome lid subunit RPN8/RPN11
MARVKISDKALEDLVLHVKKGYESCYKKEVGGFLLGKISDKNFLVAQASPYNTKNAGRTYWSPNGDTLKRKGAALEKKTGRTWIGIYHSHPETAGWASVRQSTEDRESHISSDYLLEIIVRIASAPMRSPKSCLEIQDSKTGYCYTICGYIKDGGAKTRKIRVKKA